MTNLQAHLFVTGLVQGVSFRFYTREQARNLGLTGWVKNLRDGRVEVLIEGPEDKVEQMIEWLHHGPGWARVERVDVDRGRATEAFRRFDVAF